MTGHEMVMVIVTLRPGDMVRDSLFVTPQTAFARPTAPWPALILLRHSS